MRFRELSGSRDLRNLGRIGKTCGIWVFAAALLAISMQGFAQTYSENGGLVVMEMENTTSPFGLWQKRTSPLSGYTGSGYLEFTGNTTASGPPTSPLEFNFKINKAGLYYLHLHAARDTTNGQPSDHSNDCYVRVDGDYGAGPNVGNNHGDDAPLSVLKSDTKFFGGDANQWAWASGNRLDLGGTDNKRVAVYDFKAGQTYKLVVHGRSKFFSVNRIVFRHKDTSTNVAQNLSTPESAKSGSTPPPTPVAGTVVSGELKKWHKITLTFDGPSTSETAGVNPFLDYRLNVTFKNGSKTYVVPGYYAADGNAGNTGATSGNKWRVHFAPDATGTWTWTASFRQGSQVAVNASATAGSPASFDGATGSFSVAATDKSGRDLRGKGRLQYVNKHHLRFAENGEYFLKQGPDSPENLLAYADFDGPFKTDGQRDNLVKTWAPHVGDWKAGDPTWAGGKGKGLIGAINYLASEGLNVFSFLPMNIGGDDKNVFPYLNYNERLRMDCSRLDQWEVVFEHGTKNGFYLHFKTQETENDQLLDGGDLGVQRKLYYRELIARFSHHLAMNWNLGEENTNTTAQQKSFADYFHATDPYDHPVVIHTFPGDHDKVYNPLLGFGNLEGTSIQTGWDKVFNATKTWVDRSRNAGRPWVVANDEQGSANAGIVPDANDAAHDGPRKETMWGNLMAGGAGNEYYFGYSFPHSDLTLQDFRSRDKWWDQCRHALKFFYDNSVPFWDMINDNAKSTASNDYAFYKQGFVYVVYLKNGGTTSLDLNGVTGSFEVKWYDPRNGGALKNGTVTSVQGGGVRALGNAPSSTGSDWVILVRPGGGTPPPPPPPPAPEPEPEPAPTGVVHAINAGGPAFTAADGTVYDADRNFSGGLKFTRADPIAGTTDDVLYQSERYGDFNYRLAVPNGSYTLTLHFAEIYWTQQSQRIFDVVVENQEVQTALDIFAKAGHDGAYDVEIPVNVADGFLDILFFTVKDNAKLSALKVTAGSSTTPPSGGSPQTLTLSPAQDAYLENGNRFNNGLLKVESGTRKRISYLKFDVQGLNSQPIQSAKLSFKVDTDPGSGTLRAYRGSHNNWTETTITSSSAPGKGSQVGVVTGSFSNGSTVEINVLPLVSGNGVVTVILEMDSGGNDVWFSSKEGSAAPKLTVIQ